MVFHRQIFRERLGRSDMPKRSETFKERLDSDELVAHAKKKNWNLDLAEFPKIYRNRQSTAIAMRNGIAVSPIGHRKQ